MNRRRTLALVFGFGCALGSGARAGPADLPADLKDPTLPPISREGPQRSSESPPMPIVSAIFLSPTRSVAVFNDQPVHAGDRVGGYHIDEVSARGVRYSTGGHTAFAPLTPVR